MADFDFSTLVTDRSPSDLELLRDLLATPMADWTAEQLAQFNQAASKGAYNYTDLNRVTAAMDYLNEVLTGLGYQTGYHKITVHPAVDPIHDENTLLLIHGDKITDSSLYGNIITNNGVSISQVTGKFGESSLYFDGSAFLQIDALPIAQLNSFTVDFWIYIPSSPNNSQGIFEFNDYTGNGLELEIYRQYIVIYSENENILGQLDFPGFGKWTHIAVVKNGDTLTLYVDGVSIGSAQLSVNISTVPFTIGEYAGANFLVGYIDEFRLSDIARWTSNFTPPNTPYIVDRPAVSPYIWYEYDTPTTTQVKRLIASMRALRGALDLPEDTNDLPADMTGLTQEEANNIEGILEIIHQHLTALQAVFLRAGMGWAVSGGPGYYFENGG